MKTKRVIGVLLTLIMIIGLLPITASAAVIPQKITSSNYASLGFSDSEWKKYEGYYAIHSIEELEGYRNLIDTNKTAINAVLRQNIYLGNCTWVPISNPYGGIFDGNACQISYMNNGINGHASNFVGLFGNIENMTVKNVHISRSKIYGNSYMGMIAGRAYNCNILNCYMDTGCYVECDNPQNKTINPDMVNAGGVVGEAVGSTITDCVFLGYMKVANTNTTCGLIVGNGSTATNCAYATIRKSTCMGPTGIGLSTLKFSVGTLSYQGSTDTDPFAHCFSDITQIISYTCKYIHRTAYTNPKCEETGYDSRDICMFCGDFKGGTFAASEHKYLKDCSEYCDECGEKRDTSVSHSYSTDCDEECNECGEIRTITHDYSTATCTTPETCSACGATGGLDKDNHTKEAVNGVYPCCNTYQKPELKNGYYQIENAGNLYWFANYINTVDRTANAVLVADIDLEGKSDGTGRTWTPIGSTGENNNNFRGHFDGRNHKITNLYLDEQRAGLGFFGEVRLGTVENFSIYGDVKLNGSYDYVGGVIGSAPGANSDAPDHNGATIRNITSYVNVTLGEGSHGSSYVGGFMGYANHETLIENCAWYGTLDLGLYRADSGVGGLVGKAQENSAVTIRNCGAYGTIKTSYKSGTYNNNDTIYIGGVLSFSADGAKTVLENNLWAGTIANETDLGDKAHISAFGTLRGGESVTNCYALKTTRYLTTEDAYADDIEPVSKGQLASGEVAYKLGEAWGQDLSKENSLPVLDGANVYKYADGYSNELKFGFAGYTTDGAIINIPTEGTYSLIFVDYEDERFNNIDIVPVTVTADKVGEITKASVKGVTIGTGDKIMLFGDMRTFAPFCEEYVVE